MLPDIFGLRKCKKVQEHIEEEIRKLKGDDEMWSGIESLDQLRSEAAASPTGWIKVSIEQLNQVKTEIEERG